MTDRPESSPTDEDYQNNVDLSYEYTEKSITEIIDINKRINTELGLLIGFNLTFVRFFLGELPDNNYQIDTLPCISCLSLKIIAYAFAIVSIFTAFLGLYRSIEYNNLRPDALVDRCDILSNPELKLAIIDTLQEKLEQFIELAQQKKNFFKYSIVLLGLSGLMAIFDRLIITILD